MTKKAFGSLKAVPLDSLVEVEERNRWKSAKTDLPGKWPLNSRWQWSVFIPGIVFWGIPPPKKKLTIPPPNGLQIVCSKSFFGQTMNNKYSTETFFYWTINTGNHCH